ncbi:hypothetical protein F5Y19DRAFT_429489 [Xylariaceae sp. FL1651]|nr:hypothetical protein F5Y19DRAFT_429489 [Xylariaceae sp. FL1651]
MAKNIAWLGTTLVSAAVVMAVSDSASITPNPSLPVPPTDVVIAAITPTAPGQIGITPVSIELGSPNDYVLTNLGPDNPIVTWNGDVYHYIVGHTDYLSLETVTTTVDSQLSTMTSSIKVSVQTAAAGDPSQKAGTIGLMFSEDVADALRKTADAAIQACGLNKRNISKRLDSTTCVIDAAVEASGVDGPLQGAATDEWWESIGISVSENAPVYLTNAIAVIKSQAQKNKSLAILAVILAGYIAKDGPIAAVNIPAMGVGEPDKTCDPSKPVNKDSPLCQDNDCQGDDDVQRCTTGPEKDCPCLILGVLAPLQVYDKTWWDEQQNIISSVAANPGLLGTAAPSCFVNSAGTAFDGKPAATPASWCVCNEGGTTKIYPTVDTPSSPCAYTTAPTATISPMITANSESVTSCRTETDTITGVYSTPKAVTYCTCNDNKRHGYQTWTISGSTSAGCLTPTPTPTPTTPSAMPTPTCNYPKKFTIEEDALVAAGERFCSDNNKGYLRPITGGTYGNSLSSYNSTGSSSGGQLFLYAYLDKGCETPVLINQNDCIAAFQSIFDHCDTRAAIRNGGAASVNCQWYNITAIDQCGGTIEGSLHPDKCDFGYPLGYEMWPMGTIIS